MLDLIRMDLCRMRKMNSFVVVFVIITMFAMLSTYSSKLEREMYNENTKEEIENAIDNIPEEELEDEEEYAEDEEYEDDDEEYDDVDVGLVIDSTLEDLTKPYVDQMYASFISGMFPALMIVIFTVLFVNADHNSGFIKSIGGQVRHRWQIVASKIICVMLFSLLMMLFLVVVQTAMNLFFFGEVNIYNSTKFIRYIFIAYLMNASFATLAAFVTMLFRSNLVGLVFSILDVLGMFTIVAFLVNLLVQKLSDGESDFDLNKYMLSYCVNQIKYGVHFGDVSRELIVAGCFFVVSVAGSIFVFQKRDIS